MTQEQAIEKVREWANFYWEQRTTSNEQREQVESDLAAVIALLEGQQKAVELGFRYGQIGGSGHRLWTIDQMLRLLLGERYDAAVAEANGEEYEWDTGVTP